MKDSSFKMGDTPMNGPNNSVWSMFKQTDGKLLLAGQFTDYKDGFNIVTSALRITRIRPVLNASSTQQKGLISNYFENEIDDNENKLLNDNFVIFPNPTDGVLTIEASSNENETFNIELYNILGQKVYKFENTTLVNRQLNLEFLLHGTYLIKISNENKLFQKTILIK